MKKWFLRFSVVIMVASIFLSYFLFFSMGFDAADSGWPYSYYHFLTFKRSLMIPVLITLAIVASALVRDQVEDLVRKYIDAGIFFMIIALIIALSALFFSLHALSQGGYVNGDSSMYQPLTQSLTGYLINFIVKILAAVSLTLALFKDKDLHNKDQIAK